MKPQALSDLVKRIFGDENTRRQFEANPDKVLAQFDLTREEKGAVLSARSKLGVQSAGQGNLEAAIDPLSDWISPIP